MAFVQAPSPQRLMVLQFVAIGLRHSLEPRASETSDRLLRCPVRCARSWRGRVMIFKATFVVGRPDLRKRDLF